MRTGKGRANHKTLESSLVQGGRGHLSPQNPIVRDTLSSFKNPSSPKAQMVTSLYPCSLLFAQTTRRLYR